MPTAAPKRPARTISDHAGDTSVLDSSAVLAWSRGVRVEPLSEADAVTAANLWTRTRAAGLSLGDRCCLALGARLALPTVTADPAWAGLDIDIPVRIIR